MFKSPTSPPQNCEKIKSNSVHNENRVTKTDRGGDAEETFASHDPLFEGTWVGLGFGNRRRRCRFDFVYKYCNLLQNRAERTSKF